MKLDKIRFARLIGMIANIANRTLDSEEIETIDYVIDVELPQPAKVDPAEIDELLRQISNPDGFISAIKAYRALTGYGLKEAKETIERYRVIPNFRDSKPVNPSDATLGDILATATNTKSNLDVENFGIRDFAIYDPS